MTLVTLNAAECHDVDAFYTALFQAVGAPEWHGRSRDALVDSLVYGGINDVKPPYTLRITRLGECSPEVSDYVETVVADWVEACGDYRAQHDQDCGASFEIIR